MHQNNSEKVFSTTKVLQYSTKVLQLKCRYPIDKHGNRSEHIKFCGLFFSILLYFLKSNEKIYENGKKNFYGNPKTQQTNFQFENITKTHN